MVGVSASVSTPAAGCSHEGSVGAERDVTDHPPQGSEARRAWYRSAAAEGEKMRDEDAARGKNHDDVADAEEKLSAPDLTLLWLATVGSEEASISHVTPSRYRGAGAPVARVANAPVEAAATAAVVASELASARKWVEETEEMW